MFGRNKGVKVELGIPYELWDKPSAEVSKMHRAVSVTWTTLSQLLNSVLLVVTLSIGLIYLFIYIYLLIYFIALIIVLILFTVLYIFAHGKVG